MPAKLTLSPVVSFDLAGSYQKEISHCPQTASVSRNMVEFLCCSRFSAIQMNLILAISYCLQDAIINKADPHPAPQGRDVIQLRIHRSLVTYHNDPLSTLEALKPLTSSVVDYKYPVPFLTNLRQSRLLSSIDYNDGHYNVTVPLETLPWFAYKGRGVGYGLIEPTVFNAGTGAAHKRLYLYLAVRINGEDQTFSKSFDIEELKTIFGVPESTAYSRLKKVFLQRFESKFNDSSVRHTVTFRALAESSTRRGRKPVKKIEIYLHPKREMINNNLYAELMQMNKMFPIGEKIMPTKIIDGIGLCQAEDYVERMRRIYRKEKELIDKLPASEKERKMPGIRVKMIRTAKKILKEEYGFVIKKDKNGNKNYVDF